MNPNSGLVEIFQKYISDARPREPVTQITLKKITSCCIEDLAQVHSSLYRLVVFAASVPAHVVLIELN